MWQYGSPGLISALGQQDHLLIIDCRTLETFPTPIPSNVAVIIVNSHISDDLVSGEYSQSSSSM